MYHTVSPPPPPHTFFAHGRTGRCPWRLSRVRPGAPACCPWPELQPPSLPPLPGCTATHRHPADTAPPPAASSLLPLAAATARPPLLDDLLAHTSLCLSLFSLSSISLSPPYQAQQSILSSINQDDGSDALVNAILVARGDALPTAFAGDFFCVYERAFVFSSESCGPPVSA